MCTYVCKNVIDISDVNDLFRRTYFRLYCNLLKIIVIHRKGKNHFKGKSLFQQI